MSEIIFVVNEAEEGGYTAKCLTESIFTEADTLDILKDNVKEAVACHFEDQQTSPKLIRLHFVKAELITL